MTLLPACGGGGGGGGTEANLAPLTVSVTVTGLSGTVMLQNNGKDNLSLSADGSKAFATTLIKGDGYNVTVFTHPGGQSCKVTNGSGAIQANVNIAVGCETNTIGVTVSGLNGTVVLQNNGGNDLSISANGIFSFSNHPNFGAGYTVSVSTRPVGQNCTTGNGSGSVGGAVSNITVNCVGFAPPAPTVSVQPGTKQLGFSWASNVDTAFYRVQQNPDGISGYSQLGADFATTNYTLDLSAALLHTRVNASYIVEACNNFGCTGSTAIALASQIINAIGYFKASNAGLGDSLGFTLALSTDGSTLAVGARGENSAATGINNSSPGQSDNSAGTSGAVYVFVRSGGAWTQQAYIKASNTNAGDRFGTAVALSSDGNTLAAGAPVESSAATGVNNTSPGQGDNSTLAAGAVYVFTRSGTTWTQQAYVKASNPDADDDFGGAVALSGDGNTLAVGAAGEDSAATGINNTSPGQGDNTASFAGAVYVFFRSGTTWTQQAYIKASNTNAFDQIGTSVALSNDGNTLATGAVGESSAATTINGDQADNSAANAGAVYVFVRSGITWTQQAYVKNSNTSAGAEFGFSVALSSDGSTLASGGLGGEATYVFTRSGTVWSQQQRLTASNSDPGDNFGFSATLSGDGNTLAIGATAEMSAATGINNTNPGQGDNSMTGTGAGAVYLFTRTSGVWTQRAYIKAPNTGNGDLFGESVALSGDGSTLVVGAVGESSAATGIGGNQADNSAASAGAVYLY